MDATGIATALMGDSHRDQPVHAGRRLSEGPDPGDGRGHRTGDRAERRRGQDEHGRLPLGPPRRRRPGAVKATAAPAATADAVKLSETLDEVIARRVELPDRLPGCRLCGPLQEPDRLGAPDRGRARPGLHRPDRSGRPQLLQAAGLQGRVRGGPALHRRHVPEAARRAVRGRLQAGVPSGPADAGGDRPGDRRAEEEGLWAVDAEGLPGCWPG